MAFAGRPTPLTLVLRGRIYSQHHAFFVGRKSLPITLRPRSGPFQTYLRSVRWQSNPAVPTSPPVTTQSTETSNRSLSSRILRFLFVAVSCTALGFTMAAAPAATTVTELLSPPTDEETLKLFAPDPSDISESEIEAALWAHPLIKSLLADSTLNASRPHLKLPPSMRSRSLTGGTLMGTDKMTVPPLAFSSPDGSRYVSIQHLGASLCGHPGLVHGGMLATLLDEGLARCCFPALPNKIAVTASLKVDYRKPCKAGSFVVLRAETTKVEGRKAWVTGRLETLVDESAGETPEVLVEAEALFIEPRQAAAMARAFPTQ